MFRQWTELLPLNGTGSGEKGKFLILLLQHSPFAVTFDFTL
jgi:hypothetical protein